MAEQTDENLSNTIFGKYEVRQLEILLLNYQRLCFKTWRLRFVRFPCLFWWAVTAWGPERASKDAGGENLRWSSFLLLLASCHATNGRWRGYFIYHEEEVDYKMLKRSMDTVMMLSRLDSPSFVSLRWIISISHTCLGLIKTQFALSSVARSPSVTCRGRGELYSTVWARTAMTMMRLWMWEAGWEGKLNMGRGERTSRDAEALGVREICVDRHLCGCWIRAPSLHFPSLLSILQFLHLSSFTLTPRPCDSSFGNTVVYACTPYQECEVLKSFMKPGVYERHSCNDLPSVSCCDKSYWRRWNAEHQTLILLSKQTNKQTENSWENSKILRSQTSQFDPEQICVCVCVKDSLGQCEETVLGPEFL